MKCFIQNGMWINYVLAIDEEGLLCQSRDAKGWHGCRGNKGVVKAGKYFFGLIQIFCRSIH